MVRLRQYDPDVNVLEAARRRLEHAYLSSDRLVVSFSGGKDSLCLLHLVRELHEAEGDDRPVLAVFRDMEWVNGDVLEKVAEVHDLPWVDLRWWCLRRRTRSVVLGETLEYVTWGDDRDRHHHEPPAYAWRPDGLWDEERTDRALATLEPGRNIIVTGIRTAESLIRYRSVVNKLHEPHLSAGKAKGVTLCRPIYDWQEGDVLRYLYDTGERPSAIYDAQGWVGKGQLRTASLLATEQMRDLEGLAQTDPDAYDALVELAPQIATARRYHRDLKPGGARIQSEATTLEEVEDWVYDTFSGGALAKALDRFAFATGLARKNPHGFPAWWVQREIARDGHGTGMMPLPKTHARYREGATP